MRVPAALVLTAGLVSGCATAAPPAPAVLSYTGISCSASPNLANPISLVPEREMPRHSVEAQVNSVSPCLTVDGVSTPYAVFLVPTDFEDKTIAVGGLMEHMRVFSPSVTILDASGAVSRTFEPHDYMFRGAAYSVQFRPRAGETYIVVSADPARVGDRRDGIYVGTSTTTVYTGYGASNITTGVDMPTSHTFSWEGVVQVLVNDSDTDEEG